MAESETRDWRLIPAGHLARAVGVPSSVLSYYEAKLPGIRAVADRGGRSYRRGDAMVLAGVALDVAEGASLTDVLERVGSGGRDTLTLRGRRIIDGSFPAETDPQKKPAARAVPADAIITSRTGHAHAASEPAAPRANREAILRALSECVQTLQRAR